MRDGVNPPERRLRDQDLRRADSASGAFARLPPPRCNICGIGSKANSPTEALPVILTTLPAHFPNPSQSLTCASRYSRSR